MPGYVKGSQPIPTPHTTDAATCTLPATPINYGARQQYAKAPSTATPSTQRARNSSNKSVENSSSSAAVDPTLLCPISAIASQSSKPTVETLKQTKQLLDYIATQDEAVLTYNASDMVLAIHSDASYLSEPAARSRAGDISFSHLMRKSHPTTGPSSTLPTSSNMSWPLPPANWRRLHHGPRGSLHPHHPGGTRHTQPPPRSKQTTPPPKASSTERSNPNGPKPWTCDSTGSEIANARNSSASTGAQANLITLTMD
eukprot:CCRYP_021122-RA/>CCRYP_021122-RA protein AED:0.40 eAED:0.40 QI:0/-1/0/1/-1/1/1/0/255